MGLMPFRWPLLNAALKNTARRSDMDVFAPWRAVVGWAFQHSSWLICCDGTADCRPADWRVLWNDPATACMRHADCGLRERHWNGAQEKTTSSAGIFLGN